MKASDVRAKSADELKTELLGLKKEQFNLRFQKASGQLTNTAQFGNVRRDIARALTIARQKRTGEEPKVKAAETPKAERPKVKRTAKRRAPVKSRTKPSLRSRAKAKRK